MQKRRGYSSQIPKAYDPDHGKYGDAHYNKIKAEKISLIHTGRMRRR
jgi:hypothetical protein